MRSWYLLRRAPGYELKGSGSIASIAGTMKSITFVQASRPASEYQLRTKSIGSQSEESAARRGAPTPKVSARQFTPAAALVI